VHDLKCDNYTYAIKALFEGVYKTSVSDAARDKSEIYSIHLIVFILKTVIAKLFFVLKQYLQNLITIDYYVKKEC